MGIVVNLLCVSLLVGICLAVNGTPQDKAQAQLEPRMTEISKLQTQIKDAAAASSEGDDCSDPPPRRCRWWRAPHDSHDPNSQGWVLAKSVGIGQLPDDLKAQYPKWITARTVPFLPEEPAATGEGGPCCECPRCGLSFYTPNDYWSHIVSCPAPGPRTCVQTVACLGNSHFDSDPRVCMCRPGAGPSSSAAPAPGPLGSSSSSST